MEEQNKDTKLPSDDCPKICGTGPTWSECAGTNVESVGAEDPAAAKTEPEELKSEALPAPAAASTASPCRKKFKIRENCDNIKGHETRLGNVGPQIQIESGAPESGPGVEVPTSPGVVPGNGPGAAGMEIDVITDKMMEIGHENPPALSGTPVDVTEDRFPPDSHPVGGDDAAVFISKMSEIQSNPGGNEDSQLPAEEDETSENHSGKSLPAGSASGADDGLGLSPEEAGGDQMMDIGDGNPPTEASPPPEEPDGANEKSKTGRKEPVRIYHTEESDLTTSLPNYLCKTMSLSGINFRPLISDDNKTDEEMSKIIIYHSAKSCIGPPEVMERVGSMRRTHGCADVKVMVAYLTNAGAENAFRRQWDQQPVSGSELLLFTEADQDAVEEHGAKPWNPAADNLNTLRRILTSASQEKSQKVGIFSRSSEEDYKWLRTLLLSREFRDHVQGVRPCYISNDGGPQFRKDVSQCTFGILYHTKNRGRINVTDVSSALYDKELQYLHQTLGKENVIVVIDDLDNCSSKEKNRILTNQPCIGKLSRDLLLFGKEDKSDYRKYMEVLRDKDRKLKEKLKTVTGWMGADAGMDIGDGNPPTAGSTSIPANDVPNTDATSSPQPPPEEPDGADEKSKTGSKERVRIYPSLPKKTSLSEFNFRSLIVDNSNGCADVKVMVGDQANADAENAFRCSRGPQPVSRGEEADRNAIEEHVDTCWNPAKENLKTLWEALTSEGERSRKVGIFSRSSEEDYKWLRTLLQSGAFRDHVQGVRPCYISNNGGPQFRKDVSQCTFGILYHTKNRGRINVTDVSSALYNKELQYLHQTLGKENVIVVIDDLDNCSSKEKNRILTNQPSIEKLSRDLLLFGKEHKADYRKYLSTFQDEDRKRKEKHKMVTGRMGADPKIKKVETVSEDSAEEAFEDLSGEFRNNNKAHQSPVQKTAYQPASEPLYSPPGTKYPSKTQKGWGSSGFWQSPMKFLPSIADGFNGLFTSGKKRHRVGIFSRSPEEDYEWLRTLLQSGEFRDHVEGVRPCYISNIGGSRFREDVSRCTFGILYHTKNRGRINVTDVKDSLYDKELKYLYDTFGKHKVVVVIDDLNDSGWKEKSRILESQPTIGRLARELILISKESKRLKNRNPITARDVFG